MRSLYDLNEFRDTSPDVAMYYNGVGDDKCGCFRIHSLEDKKIINIVASSDMGWDHVSVSRIDRVPTWAEMEQVKRMFFKDDEVAMQLHVRPVDHINVHDFVLHIWRPTFAPIPLPPKEFV